MRVEPWLRGTLTEVDAVKRQVLHALELTAEDVERWCAGLSDREMHAQPYSLASVAFHLRHIARSLDRLLTYAEGEALSQTQHQQLRTEREGSATAAEVLDELRRGLHTAAYRTRAFPASRYEEPRTVGRARLPATLGGLLVHCAEHTQRHSGQAITTAKVVTALSSVEPSHKTKFDLP